MRLTFQSEPDAAMGSSVAGISASPKHVPIHHHVTRPRRTATVKAAWRLALTTLNVRDSDKISRMCFVLRVRA
jgi:hypothetical protein